MSKEKFLGGILSESFPFFKGGASFRGGSFSAAFQFARVSSLNCPVCVTGDATCCCCWGTENILTCFLFLPQMVEVEFETKSNGRVKSSSKFRLSSLLSNFSKMLLLLFMSFLQFARLFAKRKRFLTYLYFSCSVSRYNFCFYLN